MMHQEAALIATVAMGFVLAFAFGFLANRLRLPPPLIGYLVAGIAVGAVHAGLRGGFHALAGQLAEMGVILLMFGVGLHFSAADLMAVRWIAVPGAIGQIVLATALGAVIAVKLGLERRFRAGIRPQPVRCHSTVVLLRTLEDRNDLDSPNGRIAMSGGSSCRGFGDGRRAGIAARFRGDAGRPSRPAFDGRRGRFDSGNARGHLPESGGLHRDRGGAWSEDRPLAAQAGRAHRFARALLRLVCPCRRAGHRLRLGQNCLAFRSRLALFSPALSSTNPTSAIARRRTLLPMRDAFAVLFFVSVGMLLVGPFDRRCASPWRSWAVLLIILLGKSLIAGGIVLLLRYPVATAPTVSARLGADRRVLVHLGRARQNGRKPVVE